MALEVERKFLLASDRWRDLIETSVAITDGLIAATDGRKTRVRISDETATLTVKSRREGQRRDEFEYEIPLADARAMLERCCGGNILKKRRHHVFHHGFRWEIDEYEGVLNGVVIAEIELEGPGQEVPIPDWIGVEVTADPHYKKINMLAARLSTTR